MSERGYLIIADITGYTRFLTGSELDHAQGVLTDLSAAILEHLKSPLALSNIQGDAFFAYSADNDILSSGQIMDSIEALYFSFRERLNSIVYNTTCRCRACANVGNLDLKFIVHHGEYASEELANRRELSGPDVILLHRLLKNDVKQQTGVSSYALFTSTAVDALDLEELKEDARPYATEVEDFGRIEGAVINLNDRWKSQHATSEIAVGDDELWMEPISHALPFGVETVWEAWWNPQIQSRWNATTEGISRVRGDPKRIRIGAVDHCAHGNETLVFRYVDVRVLKHVTVDCAIPLNGVVRWTVALRSENSGTRITVRCAPPKGPNFLATAMLRLTGKLVYKRKLQTQFSEEMKLLEAYLSDRLTSRKTSESAGGEDGSSNLPLEP